MYLFLEQITKGSVARTASLGFRAIIIGRILLRAVKKLSFNTAP
jgi:hypothetical protein